MKYVIYILLTLFLLASCQKEEYVGTPRGMGTLVLETLSVQTENVNTVFTRAVEPDLYVEIWQNGQLLTGQRYEPGKVPGKLDLPAGVYLLKTYNQLGTLFPGHPDATKLPCLDFSTGSLGQGISVACGMALAAKQSGSDINVYTLLGDGEIEEGECWEAFMFANHYKLDNLCIMVDVNGLQIDGPTREVMNSEPLDKKMDAFGFNTIVCNGNSFAELEQAFKMFDLSHGSGKPTCFLLRTTKGLGVSYMQNAVDWHGKAPNDEEYAQAMDELRAAHESLEKELELING